MTRVELKLMALRAISEREAFVRSWEVAMGPDLYDENNAMYEQANQEISAAQAEVGKYRRFIE